MSESNIVDMAEFRRRRQQEATEAFPLDKLSDADIAFLELDKWSHMAYISRLTETILADTSTRGATQANWETRLTAALTDYEPPKSDEPSPAEASIRNLFARAELQAVSDEQIQALRKLEETFSLSRGHSFMPRPDDEIRLSRLINRIISPPEPPDSVG